MDEVLRFDTLAVHAEASLSELAALEARLAALEGAGLPGGGAWALAFASGAAAVDAVARLLRPGDRVVAQDEPSPTTLRALTVLEEFGVIVEWRDLSDPSRWRFRNTSMIWLETPSLSGLKLVNLSAVSHRAHDAGALVVVENTVATPLATRPLEFGADVVIHAASGPLSGVAGLGFGAVLGREEAIRERLSTHRDDLRGQPGNLELTVASAGLAALPLRHEHQCETAINLARRLRAHASVKDVFYPGLEMHRGHSVATRQMVARNGRELYGAVIAFRLAAPRSLEPRLFMGSLEVGGSRSLIAELEPGLWRVSVGLEDVADLWADLERALNAPVVTPVEVIAPEVIEVPVTPEVPVTVPDEPAGPARPFVPANGNPTAGLSPAELERYVHLREARDAKAASLEVSRFVIASNALLAAIAQANPSSTEALDSVPGMDAERLEKYGSMLLEALHGKPMTEPAATPEPVTSAPVNQPRAKQGRSAPRRRNGGDADRSARPQKPQPKAQIKLEPAPVAPPEPQQPEPAPSLEPQALEPEPSVLEKTPPETPAHETTPPEPMTEAPATVTEPAPKKKAAPRRRKVVTPE